MNFMDILKRVRGRLVEWKQIYERQDGVKNERDGLNLHPAAFNLMSLNRGLFWKSSETKKYTSEDAF